MLFSILTATYNRSHTLPKVYASLQAQDFSHDQFEWLIMDDGSSDGTAELVRSWQQEASFKIRYYEKENGGHHTALNGIIPLAHGEFSLILDSDDTLTPNGLTRYHEIWLSIPEEERASFAGVSAQCQSETGINLGGDFPTDVYDSTNIAVAYMLKLGGDRKGFIRTDIQKQYLYLEFEGEKFISDSVVWHRIGQIYKTRYVNEVLCLTDYLEDGQTFHTQKLLTRNPQGATAYYSFLLDAKEKFSFKVRAGLHAYYVRYALHANYRLDKIIKEGSSRPLCMFIGLMAGYAFYLRDEYKDVKGLRSEKAKAVAASVPTLTDKAVNRAKT